MPWDSLRGNIRLSGKKEDRGNSSMMKLLPRHRKNALLSKSVQERAPRLATAHPIKGTKFALNFVLLSNLEWVAWRVKCGLQPGEANT
jgi:hypothetical protein